MPLLDEARAATKRPGKGCSVSIMLANLPADTAAEVAELLADMTVSAASCKRVFDAHGWECAGHQQINRHRQGNCGCSS